MKKLHKSLKAHANTSIGVMHYLNRKNIATIDWCSVNNEDEERFEYMGDYQRLAKDTLVKLDRHFGIKYWHNDIDFLNFEYSPEKHAWLGVFADPENLTFTVNKILKGDYSELEDAFREIAEIDKMREEL